jgi:hypothetical protein
VEVLIRNELVAIVTQNPSQVAGGGVPIFYAQDLADSERIALCLSRTLSAMVHELGRGTYFLTHH